MLHLAKPRVVLGVAVCIDLAGGAARLQLHPHLIDGDELVAHAGDGSLRLGAFGVAVLFGNDATNRVARGWWEAHAAQLFEQLCFDLRCAPRHARAGVRRVIVAAVVVVAAQFQQPAILVAPVKSGREDACPPADAPASIIEFALCLAALHNDALDERQIFDWIEDRLDMLGALGIIGARKLIEQRAGAVQLHQPRFGVAAGRHEIPAVGEQVAGDLPDALSRERGGESVAIVPTHPTPVRLVGGGLIRMRGEDH